MAREVYNFSVSTPAGQAITSPLITACAMPVRIVRRITIKVPPGPAGHLRFQVSATGVPIIPVNGSEWITTDNETIVWDVAEAIQSGAWQIRSYNTGIYAHAIQVRFEVDLPPAGGASGRREPLALEMAA